MSSPKELNFFNRPSNLRSPDPLSLYADNFRDAGDAMLVGESTPGYFWHRAERSPTIPEAVKRMLGEPHIVVMLRDPVDRAFSALLTDPWVAE